MRIHNTFDKYIESIIMCFSSYAIFLEREHLYKIVDLSILRKCLRFFLLIVGQNSRYCLVHKTFGQSHFTTSQCFNKILRALNIVAVDWMVKPSSSVPMKIRESTRFYPSK